MPKKALDHLGRDIARNHADRIGGAAADDYFNATNARDRALIYAESALGIAVDNHLIIAQAIAKNPAVAATLGHMVKYGYADTAIGMARDIVTNKPIGTIAQNAATNAAAIAIGGTVGSAVGGTIGRNVGAVIGSAFGPVGTIAGLVVGQAVGSFVGGVLGPIAADRAIDAAKNFISSYINQNRRQQSFNKMDNNTSLTNFSFGNGGGGNNGGGGGIGLFGNSNYSKCQSYLAGILGGNGQSNSSKGQTLYGMLFSIRTQGTNSSLGQFGSQLTLQGLVNSFNSYNGGQMAFGLGGIAGDIGGVATQAGQINGIKNSIYHIENQFIICIKTQDKNIPFSSQQLRQLMAELAVGVYMQKTVPFFSLHFNEDGSLYPVIHPAYQNTLVGEVISYLDYYMKGFLNGGIFKKQFIETWHQGMKTQRTHLKPHLIDLKSYSKQYGIKYHSLRQLMAEYGLQSDEPIQTQQDGNTTNTSIYNSKFRTSFRIISRLNKVEQEGNMFVVDAGFDVEYTIDLMPDYKQYLNQYQMQKGKMPEDYLKIQLLYRQMANQIKQVMPVLPLCKKYFQMLKVITFLTSYYKTLRDMLKITYIEEFKPVTYKVPKAFPPIPVRYYTFHKINLTFGEIVREIISLSAKNTSNNKQGAGLLDRQLLKIVETGNNNIDHNLGRIIQDCVKKGLVASLGAHYQGGLQEDYVHHVCQLFNSLIIRSALARQSNLLAQIDAINKQFQEEGEYIKIETSIFNSKPTIPLKFSYLKEILQKNLPVRLKHLQKLRQKQHEENLKSLSDQIKAQQKKLQQILKKETKQFEKQLQKQMEQVKKKCYKNKEQNIGSLKSQGQSFIAAQIQKIPAHLLSLNVTNITEFKNTVRQNVQTQIQQVIEEYHKKLKQIEQNKIKVCKQQQNNQKQRRGKFYQKTNQVRKNIIDQFQKQKLGIQKIVQENHQKVVEEFRKYQHSFTNMSQFLLGNQDLCKVNLAAKSYKNSQITFADRGYYEATGDNFKIVGGCGVKLPKIQPQNVSFGKQVLNQISTMLLSQERQKLVMQRVSNQNLMTFKTVCSDCRFSYDFREMIQFFKCELDQLQQQEMQLLKQLVQNKPIKQNLGNKKLNLRRVNRRGLNIGHISTILSTDAANLALIHAQDNKIFDIPDQNGNLPIHVAASEGQVCNLQKLLSINKGYLQTRNSKNMTPLTCAVFSANYQMVDALLKCGANVNHKLPNCLTPLFIALEKGCSNICIRLLAVPNIDVACSMPSGDTPLHIAIRLNFNQVCQLIIPKFPDFIKAKTKSNGFNPLHEAANRGNTVIVQNLLKTGKIPVDTKTDAGDTALHLAAISNSIQTINILLAYKANPNQQNKYGQTPLAKAIISNNEQCARVLANIKNLTMGLRTTLGKTCSLLATQHSLFQIFDVLVSRGEKIDQEDNLQNTCGYQLVKTGEMDRFCHLNKLKKIKNAQSLILKDISKNYSILHSKYLNQNKLKNADFDEKKLLHVAIIKDDVGPVKSWFEKNKQITDALLKSIVLKQESGKNKSVFLLAAQNGSYKCFKIFMQYFSANKILEESQLVKAAFRSGSTQLIEIISNLLNDINQPLDEDENTFAHYLVHFGMEKQLEQYQKKGLNLTLKNKNQQTTVSIAIKNNDQKMLQCLLNLTTMKQYPETSFSQILKTSKKQCYKVIQQMSKNKLRQLEMQVDSGPLILSAIQNQNLTDLSIFLAKGFNPNKIVNGKSLLHEAINKGRQDMVDLLLLFKADPAAKINNIDSVQFAVKHNRINIIQIFHKYHHIKKDVYSTSNPITRAALNKDFQLFKQCATSLVQSIMNLNLKLFESKLKQFPVDQLIQYKQNIKKPLIFYCYQYEFEAGIQLLASKANPLRQDQKGQGLGQLIIKSDSPKQLISFTKKYFKKYQRQILVQNIKGKNLIQLASIKGNDDIINQYVDISENLTMPLDQQGNNMLHLAVLSNNSEMVQKLLKKKVWINLVNSQNYNLKTSLMLACLKGNQRIVKLLLKNGAKSDQKDIFKNSCLHYSLLCQKNNSIFGTILPLIRDIDVQNRMGLTPLMIASLTGKPNQIKRLLKLGAQIEASNDQGFQAIHYAAQSGSVQCLAILIDEGADPNCYIINKKKPSESRKQTPAHIAARSGNYKFLNYLFNHGSNLGLKNSAQQTPIQIAIMSKNKPTENMLKQFPFYHNIDNEWNLLKAAVVSQNQHILKQFILRKFNTNITNATGRNVLHIAAINDSPRSAAILIQQGVSIQAKDVQGNTPLHYAAQSGSQSIVEMLAQFGMNTQNQKQQTPFHIACKNNHISIVITLLKNGCDFAMVNKIGMTAAQIALHLGHYQICQLLICCGDRSLQKGRINLLPEHIKFQLTSHKNKLQQMQGIIQINLPSGMLIAMKFRNTNAIKLLLSIRPYEVYIPDPSSKKMPNQIAKIQNLYEANIAFIQFFALYKDTKFKVATSPNPNSQSQPQNLAQKSKPKPLNPNPNQNCDKEQASQIKKIPPFDATAVMSYLKQHKKTDIAALVPGFMEIMQTKSMQLCIMYSLGVQKISDPALVQFTRNWVTILAKLRHHALGTQFEQCFLTYYSWDFFYFPIFFQLVNKILFDVNNQNLSLWFLKFFEPVIVHKPSQTRKNAILTFSKFYKTLEQYKLLSHLKAPPKICISFWLNEGKYLEQCIKVVECSANKSLQTTFLSELPDIKDIQAQVSNKNMIVCKYYSPNRVLINKTKILQSFDLDMLEKDFINLCVNKFPTKLNQLLKFFKALKEISSKDFTLAQKHILAKIFVLSISFTKKRQNNHAYSFLQLAKRVKYYLGLQIFEMLYNNNNNQQIDYSNSNSEQNLLNLFCKISQIMIEINRVQLLKEILQKSMPNLQKLLKLLNEKYMELLRNKYPQKSMQILKNQFLTRGQFIKQPLSLNQFQSIEKMYNQIVKIGSKIYQCSTQQLKQRAQQLGLKIRQDSNNAQAKSIIIAIIREIIRRKMKILPYNTQILTVLGIINQNSKDINLKGRIAQVRTGQGKSTIVTILSTYLALQGYFIDIITSSQYLARRDYQKYSEFYEMLGITSSHICYNHPPKTAFNGQILFGTNYDFQFSILRDELYDTQLRYTERNGQLVKRDCQVVIVDQVDSLFLDMAMNSARLAVSSPFHTSWIYQIIYYYTQNKIKCKQPPNTQQLKQQLINYRNGMFSQTVQKYSEQKLEKWIKQAKRAAELEEDKNYVVRYNKQKQKMEIIIVDFQNTGRLNVGSRWSNGLHQFVEVKHKINPEDQSLTAASMSHPAFFSQYHHIFGLTGTIGTEQQRIQVQKIYKVDSFDVPPHYPSKRKRLPLLVCKQANYYQKIYQQMVERKKKKQPILILMKSINETVNFSKYLKNKQIKHLVLNQMQKQDEDYIVSKAGLLNSVVVATNTAGRGTDIILSPQAKNIGGLHVIFAFYPANSRVEDQGLGRAGRQGQEGSCQVLFHENDQQYSNYKNFLAIEQNTEIQKQLSKLRQQKIRSLSQAREKQSIMQTIKYMILQNFCKELSEIRYKLNEQKDKAIKYIKQCMQFSYNPKMTDMKIKQNPLMQKIILKGMNLLQLQNQGRFVDWTQFIQTLIEQQVQYIQQQWGVYYSDLINNSYAIQPQLYQILIFASFQIFCNSILAPYQRQLQEKLKNVINTALNCCYEQLNSKENANTNRIPNININISINKMQEK